MLAKLNQLLKQAGIKLTDQQKKQLINYLALLIKWNKVYNLTSITDPEKMLVKHIMDSIVIAPYLKGNQFIDVGTGAGLPGIPLAIVMPEAQFVLLDSLGKRIRFLKQVCFELKMTNVVPIQSRVEQFMEHQGFDGIISRAFASIQDMLFLCKHLSKENNSYFYALKGIYPEEELKQLPENFILKSAAKLEVPEIQAERHLIILAKKN